MEQRDNEGKTNPNKNNINGEKEKREHIICQYDFCVAIATETRGKEDTTVKMASVLTIWKSRTNISSILTYYTHPGMSDWDIKSYKQRW